MRAPELNVMIAEDDAIVALDLRQQLEARGYRVTGIVGRSEDVVSAVKMHRPDVVIMDVRLDGSDDGVTLGEEIFVCEDTPVVFLSAYAEDTICLRAVHCGAYGYLTKPVAIQALASTVEMAVHKHRDLRHRRTEGEWLTEAFNALQESLVILDREGLVLFMNQAAVKLTGWMLAQAREAPPPWVGELTTSWDLAQQRGVFTAIIPHISEATIPVSARGVRLGTGGVVYLFSRIG